MKVPLIPKETAEMVILDWGPMASDPFTITGIDITIIRSTKKARNVTTKIWVYKKVDGKYNLTGHNQPFSSKLQAYKALNISPKTIAKFIDSHNSYKELFFFSEKIN